MLSNVVKCTARTKLTPSREDLLLHTVKYVRTTVSLAMPNILNWLRRGLSCTPSRLTEYIGAYGM